MLTVRDVPSVLSVSLGSRLLSGARPKLVDQLRRAFKLDVSSCVRWALGNDLV